MRNRVIILLVIFLCLLTISCGNKHFSTLKEGVHTETITKLSKEINTKEDALQYFNKWLIKETNFNHKTNEIESIEKYKDYYEVQLKTSIIINGRTEGFMGSKDYVMTKDGYLIGFYYYSE